MKTTSVLNEKTFFPNNTFKDNSIRNTTKFDNIRKISDKTSIFENRQEYEYL